jgi:hypothetical protein
MKTTEFYGQMLTLYSRIQFPPQYDELATVNKFIAYYLADKDDQLISARQTTSNCIVELDIKSAFPTICRRLFGEDSEFVQKMEQLTKKTERLIYIATTLKEAGDYLAQLNIICKMAVLGIICEIISDDILVLELKKDGILFTCSHESYELIRNNIVLFEEGPQEIQSEYPFTNFINENGFRFHLTKFDAYYRCNKTSTFYRSINSKYDLKFKGKYKYIPKLMKDNIHNILTLNYSMLEKIREIYSVNYLKICRLNGLNELLENYYICDNDCVIDESGNYVKLGMNTKIDPGNYLRTFIFPAILTTKMRG